VCRELRPGGFNDDDPLHMCAVLTIESIVFSTRFISDWFGIEMKLLKVELAKERNGS
jgi:hypothetical protein